MAALSARALTLRPTAFQRKVVNQRVLSHSLLRLQTRERKHADLRLDVTPLSRRVQLDEVVVQALTHRDDTVSHTFDLAKPLLVELGGAKDLGDDQGAAKEGKIRDGGQFQMLWRQGTEQNLLNGRLNEAKRDKIEQTSIISAVPGPITRLTFEYIGRMMIFN